MTLLPQGHSGRTAIVTGAGRGIGRAEALELARSGAHVVVNDVDADTVGEVVEAIEKAGGQAHGHPSDIARWDSAGELVEAALRASGRLDIVVNNAGILRDAMSFSLTEAAVDATLAVNVKGTLALSAAAAAHWRSRAKSGQPGWGRLINTTSESGLFPNPSQAVYAASKAAVAAATVTMARELYRYGVTVNAIAPRALTRLTDGVLPPGADAGQFDPHAVATVVAWLASEQAASINGQVLIAWGGILWALDGWRAAAEAAPPAGGWTTEALQAARATLFPHGALVSEVALPGA